MGYSANDIIGFNRGGYLGDFPSPWRTMAAAAMPRQNADALKMCEFAWNADSTYRTAQERVAAYFLTDIDVTSPDDDNPTGDDEKEKAISLLQDTLSAREVAFQANIDIACYGNAFLSMVVPFKRFLVDTSDKNRTEYEFERAALNTSFAVRYDLSKNEFTAISPATKARCKFDVVDRPDDIEKKLKVKCWSPHEIDIVWDDYTGDCRYVWKIPEDYKKDLRNNIWHKLARCPRAVLEAASKNQWFMFEQGTMLHLKEHTVSGLRMRGWGLSRVLLNYRDIFHVQVLRCYNEAIAMDYVMPLRLITPATAQGQPDGSLGLYNMGDARGQITQMLRKRRMDPTSWHTLGFPVEYHLIGGDAKQLVPHEMLQYATDNLLNGANTPAELYRGTLQLEVAPVALRLFESANVSVVRNNNRLLQWLIEQASQLLPIPMVTAKFKRVTHADDFNKQMAALQLFMGRQLSGTTAFGAMGFDFKNEQRTLAEETSYVQKLQADQQEEMDQAAYGEAIAKGQAAPGMPPGGGMAPGGAAPAGDPAAAAAMGTGGVTSALQAAGQMGGEPSLPDMLAQAEAVAQELLALPSSQRISELRALKQKNSLLHTMVKGKLEETRSAARSAGQAALLPQAA